MCNCFAMAVWLKFLSISIFFISAVFIFAIVKKLFTFVNYYFRMLNDIEIKGMLARQVKKFIATELGDVGPEDIAKAMREDFPKAKITRQWIRSQIQTPGWAFIFWLKKRYRMNFEWLLEGEKNKDIPMLKI